MRSSFLVIGAVALLFAQQTKPAVEPCAHPRPPGFDLLDDVEWVPPWVYATGSSHKPLDSMHFDGAKLSGVNVITLDDGSRGTVKVEEGPCAAPQECAPEDCGCLPHDSFWIRVLDRAGPVVASRHLWAAYGSFDIVSVDLVDGPGDELLVIRSPGRGARPVGRDLKILSVSSTRQSLLFAGPEPLWLGQNLGSEPVACARWRGRLEVDMAEPRPRALTLITHVGAAACGRVFEQEQRSLQTIRARRVLRVDKASGLYTLRAAGDQL